MKAVISIILIGISAGLFFWYMQPAWAVVGQTQLQVNQYKSDVAQAEAAKTKYSQLITTYNSFSPDDLVKLQKFLPRGIDPIRFSLALNSVASAYSPGLASISVGTAGAVVGSGYYVMPITFSVAMTYPNFLLFLRDLERSLPPTDVTNLSFTSPDAGSTYTFTVTAQTYYLQ
jgi:hypothetical protein